MTTKYILRVVLASPGDVQAERDEMAEIIEQLNGVLRDAELPGILELYLWERDAYPGLHPQGAQGQIDDRLRIGDSDLLIGIFWKRFGTPVADAGSGTEHEIRLAIDGWKARRAPQVMLYFKTTAFVPASPDEIAQWEALQAFKADLLATEPLLVDHFDGVEQFAGAVQKHIRAWMFPELRKHCLDVATPVVRYSLQTTPVLVRAEGISELVGECLLQCRYDAATPAERLLWFSGVLAFPTQVSGRLKKQETGQVLAEPFVLEVGRPGHVTYVKCTVHGNIAVFGPVPLPSMQPAEARTFLIGNIRCNVNGISDGVVVAHLTVSGGLVENPSQVVAYVRYGLHVELRTPDGSQPSTGFRISQTRGLALSPIAVLRYTERFDNAFKPQVAPLGLSRSPVDPTVLAGESYVGPAIDILDDVVRCAGPADTGTRLQVTCRNLPAGIRLFVSRNELPNVSGLRALLVDSASTLIAGDETKVEGGVLRELCIRDDRSAVATWEVIAPTAEWHPQRGALDFAIYACCDPDTSEVGTCIVNGNFAPTSTVTGANPSAPIPRFIDTSTAKVLLRVEAQVIA